MPNIFYPAVMYPADKSGLYGVVIPGVNVNGTGKTMTDAFADAAEILQEVIDDLGGSDAPAPADMDAVTKTIDANGGTLTFISAIIPGKTVRINVTLPEDLIKRIDAVAPNRSAFLAKSALEELRR